MRPLLLSLGVLVLVVGAVWAQNSGESESMPQLPVGQTFKQFEYPIYQQGVLKATLSAQTATGITLNRAQTSNLVIKTFDNGTNTTTISSPDADLYVNEQKMRTKNTVLIEREDMEALSQNCDFDLKTKKYILRTNVKVTLKHFDVSMTPGGGPTPKPMAPGVNPAARPAVAPSTNAPAAVSPLSLRQDSMLESAPGSYADPNSAPAAPGSPNPK